MKIFGQKLINCEKNYGPKESEMPKESVKNVKKCKKIFILDKNGLFLTESRHFTSLYKSLRRS